MIFAPWGTVLQEHFLPLFWVQHFVMLFLLWSCLRGMTEHRLQMHYTKRAYKEQLRSYCSKGLYGWLTLHRQRTMLLQGDSITARYIRVHNASLWLMPAGILLLISAASHLWAIWAAFGVVLAETVCAGGFALYCRFYRARSSKVPHAGISWPAVWMRYGYALCAMIFLGVEQIIPAALLLVADGIHILVARAMQWDSYYCFMQSVNHRPMTPHHHSASFRNDRKQDKDMRNTAWLLIGLGVVCGALFLLPPT